MSLEKAIGFAGATVHFAARDAASEKLLSFLFSDFRECSDLEPDISFELECPTPSNFTLLRNGSPVFEHKSAATAGQLLLGETVHGLVSLGNAFLILHAAAVSQSEFNAVLPGASGMGKSTLSAWLNHRGYGYHSDELVGLKPNGGVVAFPRPICLEPDAHGHLSLEIETAKAQGRLLSSDDATLLKPKSPMLAGPRQLNAIVFPAYVPDASVTIQEVPRSEAAIRMLGTLANSAFFRDRGFTAFSSIIRNVEVYDLTYGNLDQSGDAVLEFLESLRRRLGSRNPVASGFSA